MQLLFSNHAIKQMFSRNIEVPEVEKVIREGEIIMNYPDDKPHPSQLMLGFVKERPVHVVCSFNAEENIFVIITTYEPSTEIWENDFKTRKV